MTESTILDTPPRWDLSKLYDSEYDPRLEADMLAAEEAVSHFVARWQHRTDYLHDPAVLRVILDEMETLCHTVGAGDKPAFYLTLRGVTESGNSILKGLKVRIDERVRNASSQMNFVWLQIGHIPPAMQERILAAPDVEPYWRILSRRFALARHDLDQETTRILSDVLPQAGPDWTTMIKDQLSNQSRPIQVGDRVIDVPFPALYFYLDSPDTCDAAAAAMTDILRSVAPYAAHEINAVIRTVMATSRHRGWSSPAEEAFAQDDIDGSTINSMLSVVERYYPRVHEYYSLKARLFGVPRLNYGNRAATYGRDVSLITWPNAVEAVGSLLEALDPSLAYQFAEALKEGHIDAEPREGKVGGAKCWQSLISLPSYLHLSFTGTLRSVETLAHEIGHYLSDLLMRIFCDAFTFTTGRPMSEVSGMFLEQLLLQKMLDQADEEERLTLLMRRLEVDVGSIFRQTAATRFEQSLYRQISEQGYLSLEEINRLFHARMHDYLGEAVELEVGSELGWIYWEHFRKQYYNYSYAFASLVAKAMCTRVVSDPRSIVDIKQIMGSGTRLSAQELLAGVDMDITNPEFWQAGLNEWSKNLDEAERLARKLGKI